LPADPEFADFLARIRAGDDRAAEELVRKYESAVRTNIRIRLTDPKLKRLLESVDICQSVLASFFVRAAAGQFDLETPAQLVALLMKMAQNKLAMQARHHHAEQRDQRRAVDLAAQGGEVEAGGAGPATLAANRDLLEAFRARLTEEERTVADRRAAGQGWAEIAQALGGTADQRRVQYTRAVDRAAAELGLNSEE
jgi:RNA polymerase sigma-70 factor (ECF subfamily)